MFNHGAEARAFTIGDLPLIQRLKARGISMDSATYLSRGLHTLTDATLSRLPLGHFGTPTVIVRYAEEQAFGQLRHEPGSPDAHIVFVAPALPEEYTPGQESAWLLLLDTLLQAAGERGAHNLHAEVDENSAVFEALRRAGFASYARQDIWRRPPRPLPQPRPAAILHPATADDAPAIRFLHAQTVPRLAQKADPVPDTQGMVYLVGGEARAYLAVSAGARGIYVKPYLLLEDAATAGQIFAALLWTLEHATHLPLYCCVRQYQGWLGQALGDLGFAPWARQTVLVRHTAARIERPAFASLPSVHNGIHIPGRPTSHC